MTRVGSQDNQISRQDTRRRRLVVGIILVDVWRQLLSEVCRRLHLRLWHHLLRVAAAAAAELWLDETVLYKELVQRRRQVEELLAIQRQLTRIQRTHALHQRYTTARKMPSCYSNGSNRPHFRRSTDQSIMFIRWWQCAPWWFLGEGKLGGLSPPRTLASWFSGKSVNLLPPDVTF